MKNHRRRHASGADGRTTRCGLPTPRRSVNDAKVTCPECLAAPEPEPKTPSTSVMSAPDHRIKASIRTVTATFRGDEWHLDHPGADTISVHLDPVEVIREVRRLDKRLANASGGAVITTLEWINVPVGFAAPGAEVVDLADLVGRKS